MRAKVTAVSEIDEQERTTDLTVLVSSDGNTPLATYNRIVKVDGFSESVVIATMDEAIRQEKLKRSPIPITKAQVEAAVLGLEIVRPG